MKITGTVGFATFNKTIELLNVTSILLKNFKSKAPFRYFVLTFVSKSTEQEMIFLLSTKFSVRVDLDREVVEHVKRVDDHGVVSSASSNPTDSDRDLEPGEMEVKKLKVQ